LGLASAEFQRCVEDEAEGVVTRDRELGAEVGVSGTPTVFVGHVEQGPSLRVSRVFLGNPPLAELRDEIEELKGSAGGARF
jgi:protein-disulfide isomerase